MDRIKVLEVIHGGYLGGGQAQILSILRNVNRDKFDISIAADGGGKFEEEVNKLGFRFFPVELPRFLRHRYLKSLQRIYDEYRFDIVHSHGGVGGFYGRLLKRHNRDLKCVHTFHAINYLNYENPLVKGVSKSIDQYLVQFTDLAICVSEADYKTAIENRIASPEKTTVIRNGIDISRFANNPRNNKLKESLGLTPESFVVGNVSKFTYQKNQRLIIQASYYLLKKYPEMRFVLVGDGPLLKRIKEYARESELEGYVVFTGERTNIPDYYSIFDVFAFPSFWEGASITLLEAMASRVPVICSNIPCHLEIIKNNYSALTVNPHEADDLISKISILYKNPELREKLSSNAMIEVTQYDEGEMTDKVEESYESVVMSDKR